MKHIEFVVKVNRSGTHTTEYVQRIDRSPIQTTADRKLALIMGKFAAEWLSRVRANEILEVYSKSLQVAAGNFVDPIKHVCAKQSNTPTTPCWLHELLTQRFATIRSSLPSPLTSATVTDDAP